MAPSRVCIAPSERRAKRFRAPRNSISGPSKLCGRVSCRLRGRRACPRRRAPRTLNSRPSSPCFTETVGPATSRKRSRQSEVAIQMSPFASSKNVDRNSVLAPVLNVYQPHRPVRHGIESRHSLFRAPQPGHIAYPESTCGIFVDLPCDRSDFPFHAVTYHTTKSNRTKSVMGVATDPVGDPNLRWPQSLVGVAGSDQTENIDSHRLNSSSALC